MKLGSIFWADDILILSESKEGLQQKLDKLNEYCKENKLSVNTEKTKCIVFSKSGRIKDHKFTYGGSRLDTVNRYKYLGFLVSSSGSLKCGLDDLRVRALKSLMSLKNSLGYFFRKNVKNTLHLYNTMVKPIILYASDFWGSLTLPQNNPVENLHNMFCKQLLGVQKQTNITSVLLELGQTPLTFEAVKNSMNNWSRIARGECNNLLKESARDAELNELPWIKTIKTTLITIGLANLINDIPKNLGRVIHQRLNDQFHQSSFEYIQSGENKLSFYGLFKKEIGMENYLSMVTNIKHRSSLTRFRMSNHSLNIEKGRHQGIVRDKRKCQFCPVVKDERHFLLSCPKYDHLRNHLLNDKFLDDDDNDTKIIKLLQEEPICTAEYIHTALEERELCMEVDNIMDSMLKKVEEKVQSNEQFFVILESQGNKLKLRRI